MNPVSYGREGAELPVVLTVPKEKRHSDFAASTPGRSGVIGSPGVAQGNAGVHGRSFARMRFDFEGPARKRDALPHSEQSQLAASSPAGCIRVETPSIILDDRHGMALPPRHDHADSQGRRVAGDVRECLLHDAIERRFHPGRETPSSESRRLEVGRDSRARLPAGDELTQGRFQPQIIEDGWTELDRDVVQLPSEFLGEVLNTVQLRGHGLGQRTGRTDGLDLQHERGQRLPNLVVQLARKAATFFLLRRREPTLQFGAISLGPPLLSQIACDPEQATLAGPLSVPVRDPCGQVDVANVTIATFQSRFECVRGDPTAEALERSIKPLAITLDAEERQRLINEEFLGTPEQNGCGLVGLQDHPGVVGDELGVRNELEYLLVAHALGASVHASVVGCRAVLIGARRPLWTHTLPPCCRPSPAYRARSQTGPPPASVLFVLWRTCLTMSPAYWSACIAFSSNPAALGARERRYFTLSLVASLSPHSDGVCARDRAG
jgi:hypothetical protein